MSVIASVSEAIQFKGKKMDCRGGPKSRLAMTPKRSSINKI